MHKKVTKPQIRKMIREQGNIEIMFHHKHLDINHILNSGMQVKIESMDQLEEKISNEWVRFTGSKTQPQFSIWIDDEEDEEEE